MAEQQHCIHCGTELDVDALFCTQCGSRLQAPEKPATVTSQNTTDAATAETAFLANAKLGRNRWWIWVIVPIFILVIWQGIGAIPWLTTCLYLKNAKIPQFTCDFVNISGDSFIPEYLLSNYMFIIGIIGAWISVKLIHKKTLIQVVTGRSTYDIDRTLYAIWIGALIFAGLLILNRLFLHTDMVFRDPSLSEYVTFFLFAIVLTPLQAGLEEVFFRGYLIQGLSLIAKNRFVLVAITSLIFMAVHLLNPEPYEYGFGPYVSSMLIIGVFLSLFTLLDGGIELAVGYHALNNLWVALIANTEVTAMPTPSLFVVPMEHFTFYPDVIMELIVLSVVFAIFDWKYGWSSWTRIKRTFKFMET